MIHNRTKVENIIKEVPEIKTLGYLNNLAKALEKQKKNYRRDNPFQKVKGIYTFTIDTSKSSKEKTDYIHKKLINYLYETTGQVCVFKPGDNSKIYPLGNLAGNKHPSKPMSYKLSYLLKDAPPDIKKLLTQYPEAKKSKITIKITNEPIDIIKKSTHQSWKSCETIGDTFCKGVFSDIANNNAIAYIYIDDNRQPDGRFMLRWCETPEKKADIGIEPIMYPRKSYSMEIYELLKGIIEGKGYGSYKSCTTPYSYAGYSDYLGGSGVITYYSGKTENILIQYASLPDISRNLALALADHTVDTRVRRALAENKSICKIDDVVNKLSKDIDPDTKEHLINTCARSQNKLTGTAINNLINDENKDVRGKLAHFVKDLSKDLLDRLANDVSSVRYELSHNDGICKYDDITVKLSKDNEGTRQNIIETCSKHGLSEKVVDNIINDKNNNVRGTLALHVKDKKYLDILSNDKDYFVRWKLAFNSSICKYDDITNKLSKDTKTDVKENLIDTCTKSPNKLNKIAFNNLINDKDEYVRRAMARHIKDKKYLYILANDTMVVRGGLAENASICKHEDLVNKLSKDDDKFTKMGLISTCTESPNRLTETAINNLIYDKDEEVRSRLAQHIQDKKYLDILANDNSRVREGLAENDSICKHEDLVNKLSKDNDRDIKLKLIQTCDISLNETAINNLLYDKDEEIRMELSTRIEYVRKKLGISPEDIEQYYEQFM